MTDEISDWVAENPELLAGALLHGDPHVRAFALVLLRHGGTKREKQAVIEEVEELC
jgi:hypothetical protein